MEPQPLSITARGGIIIDNITRKQPIYLLFLKRTKLRKIVELLKPAPTKQHYSSYNQITIAYNYHPSAIL